MKEFKGTKVFPKYNGGDNYSIDLIFDNDAVISINRRSRYGDELVMSREEMEANALLISKAPEMLQMLQYILKEYKDSECFSSHDSQLIENLIKQATEL